MRVRVGGVAVGAGSPVIPVILLACNFLLAGIRGAVLADVADPDLLVHDLKQGAHIGEAGGDDADGGLDAGPDAGVDLVVWKILDLFYRDVLL